MDLAARDGLAATVAQKGQNLLPQGVGKEMVVLKGGRFSALCRRGARISASRIAAGLAVLLCSATPSAQLQAKGYSGVYGGGPIYKNRDFTISELSRSGFSEIIVWAIHIDAAGNLNLNGEFPLTAGGAYVGNSAYPNFPSDMAGLKKNEVKRITLSIIGQSRSGDFGAIKSLIAREGTGPNSTLYKDFSALKAAVPSVDAIDFDDETTYDLKSSERFALMLGKIGYHVTIAPYTKAKYWRDLIVQTNRARPGTIDAVHLQVYDGGAHNQPCGGNMPAASGAQSWNFGEVPLLPGLWDRDLSPQQAQAKWERWTRQCGISGGFLWLYDDITGKTYNGQTLAQAYATAINAAIATRSGSRTFHASGSARPPFRIRTDRRAHSSS